MKAVYLPKTLTWKKRITKDDVTFSSYQEAVNACENWAKVNL